MNRQVLRAARSGKVLCPSLSRQAMEHRKRAAEVMQMLERYPEECGPVEVDFDPAAFDWIVPDTLKLRAGLAVRVGEDELRLNAAAARALCGGEVPERVPILVGTAPRSLAVWLVAEGVGYTARRDRGGLRVHCPQVVAALRAEGWPPGVYLLKRSRQGGLLVAERPLEG